MCPPIKKLAGLSCSPPASAAPALASPLAKTSATACATREIESAPAGSHTRVRNAHCGRRAPSLPLAVHTPSAPSALHCRVRDCGRTRTAECRICLCCLEPDASSCRRPRKIVVRNLVTSQMLTAAGARNDVRLVRGQFAKSSGQHFGSVYMHLPFC